MKKVLLGILALLVITVGIAYGYGTTLSDEWHIEETIVIEAAPKHVYPAVVDLTTWKQWTAWNEERDPEGQWTYEGEAGKVGHAMTWDGPELGKGRLVLTEVKPNEGIRYDLFFNDSPENSLGRISLEAKGDGTLVTWTDDLVMESPFMRIVGPTIQEMVSEDFAKGLENLKKRSLNHARNFPDPPAEVATTTEDTPGDGGGEEDAASPASALEATGN